MYFLSIMLDTSTGHHVRKSQARDESLATNRSRRIARDESLAKNDDLEPVLRENIRQGAPL